MVRKKDLLICIREDNYCIDTLEMVKYPQINEVVEVEQVIKDIDGVWLCLIGYDIDMFDSNCFRKLTLEDIKLMVSEEVESVS